MSLSVYTPASWNSSLYLNQLRSEIAMIEQYIGLTFNLIPKNGITVTGTSQNFTVTGTTNNQYAYSNLQRNEPWNTTAYPQEGIMFIGVSTNIEQIFNPSSCVSMQMINYGIYANMSASKYGYITNGVFSGFEGGITAGQNIGLSYDGTTLKYMVNNDYPFDTSASIAPVSLIVGCFEAGSISKITWTGSGGGSVTPSVNLAEVLLNGNDAQNQGIINLQSLELNGRIGIDSDNDCQIVLSGSESTAKPHVAMVFGNSLLSFQSYGYSASLNMLDLNGDISQAVFGTKNLLVGGDSQVFDVKYNNPNFLVNSNVSNLVSKQFQVNSPTSILQWDLTDHPNNNNFTLFLDNLSFNMNVQGENVTSKFLFIYISTILNGDFDTSIPDNIGWTSANICPSTGGNLNQTGSNIILSNLITTFPNTKLYLNVKIATLDLINAFYIQDLTFKSTLTCNNVLSASLNPTTL